MEEENKYYNPEFMGLDQEGLFDDEEFEKKKKLGLVGEDEAIDEEALLKILGGDLDEPKLKSLQGTMSDAEKEYMMQGVPHQFAEDKIYDRDELLGTDDMEDFTVEGSEDLPPKDLFESDPESNLDDDDSEDFLKELEGLTENSPSGVKDPKTPAGVKIEKTSVKPASGKDITGGMGKPSKGESAKRPIRIGAKKDEDTRYPNPFDSRDIKGKMSKGKPGFPPFKEATKEKVEILPATEPSVEEDPVGAFLMDALLTGGVGGIAKLVGKAGLKGLLGRGAAEGAAGAKSASPLLRTNLNPSTARDPSRSLWERVGNMAREAGGSESLPIRGATNTRGKLKLQYPDATNITGASSSNAAKRFGGFSSMNRSDAMRAAERIVNQLKKPGGGNIESIRTQLQNLGLSQDVVEEIIRSNMASRSIP